MRFETIVAAIVLSALLAPPAQARPDTRSMTCNQLLAFVERNGAVVMDTGPRTYKRFVYHRGFCQFAETVRTEWVRSSDGECRLRICEPVNVDRDAGR